MSQLKGLTLPHLTFYPDIFDEVSKGFSEEVRKEARDFLEHEREVAEAPGLFPEDARPGGHGMRASPSGTVKAAQELSEILSRYWKARRKRRKAELG